MTNPNQPFNDESAPAQPAAAPQTQPVYAPPMQAQQYQYQGGVPQPKATSGLAIAALVLGIVGLVLSFIPIINNVAFFIGVIGAILGVIAIVKTGDTAVKKGRGMAITGLILSVLAVVITLLIQLSFSAAFDALGV